MTRFRHEERVAAVQDQLLRHIKQGTSSALTQRRSGSPSNLTRSHAGGQVSSALDMRPLHHVLSVDVDRSIVITEPGVTMSALARETLRFGYLPAILPEFRGITVGGALSGAGIESTAHRYGLLHDTLEWCDVLLGNGEIRRLSAESDPDLFYGLAGAYGSLGYIVCAALRLVKAQSHVALTYEHVEGGEAALARLQELMTRTCAPTFIDAVVFGQSQAVVMHADLSSRRSLPRHKQRPYFRQWFYAHAKEARGTELLSIEDYLFRYDRAAFWMGQYLLDRRMQLALLFRRRRSKESLWKLLSSIQAKLQTQSPSLLFRLGLGWALSSQNLYAKLHQIPEEQIAHVYLIQDCCVPYSQAARYLACVKSRYQIYPIWLCPVRRCETKQLFSPHQLAVSDEFLVNVGIYGVPTPFANAIEATCDLEEQLPNFSGRKALYSHSYYSPEIFWELYDKQAYAVLRQKTGAEAVFASIEQKVLASIKSAQTP